MRPDLRRSKKSGGSTISGRPGLSPDFKDFFRSLNANGVRYLVVGGYAVALHGHPRYTRDIDIWVEPTDANAASVVRAVDEFGFGSLGLSPADLLVPGQFVQLGMPPNRIDLMGTLPGVEFAACYTTRLAVEIDGVRVDFIDLENLKRNKRAVGRAQDLADLENLE